MDRGEEGKLTLTKTIIKKSALRDLVNEALDGGHLGDLRLPGEVAPPVNVNAVVDPSAAQTDPMNCDFVPQTKQELEAALKEMMKSVSDDEAPAVYSAMKDALVDFGDDGEEEQMKKKGNEMDTARVEEAVRVNIRKIISEISPRFDMSYSGTDFGHSRDPKDADDDDDDLDDDGNKRRRAYKSTAIGGMEDVGGASFEDIAADLGFSVAGAKQAVDKALEKARFLAGMDEDDKEILILTAMNDYIDQLASSGELSPQDVQLMKDHPDIVRELDGFREFLHTAVRRIRRPDQKIIDPIGEGHECLVCGSKTRLAESDEGDDETIDELKLGIASTTGIGDKVPRSLKGHSPATTARREKRMTTRSPGDRERANIVGSRRTLKK